jgi:glycosyltransferase involved in cell wall biosynthesis
VTESATSDAPPVSIITAAYNAAAFLGRTIESVLRQTFGAFEWVVADDGSGDGTPELLEALGDPRVRVLRRPVNGGPSAARNTAIAAARGAVMVLLDHDDLWAPTRLERLVALLDSEPRLGFASTNMWVGDPALPAQARTVLDNPSCRAAPLAETRTWMAGCSFSASTMAVRRSALDRVGWFNEDLWYTQDWELALRLHLAGEHASMLPEPLGWTVMHRGQLSDNPDGVHRDRRRTLQTLIASSPNAKVTGIARHQLRAWERLDAERRVALAIAIGRSDPTAARRLACGALRRPRSARALVAGLACVLSPRAAAAAAASRRSAPHA